jgi:chromosome segregation ATPase
VGNGLMHDDISSMSTAQKSMISMILSFSLLYQSSTKYNIIKLDEIDGGLDSVNRPYFITLLDNLMNMLKCEQAFIISHNSELDDTSCDVILLKDDIHNSLVSDKANIIWRAS